MNKRFDFDKENQKGYDYLIGTDEAGRGPGAGPVFGQKMRHPGLDQRFAGGGRTVPAELCGRGQRQSG